MLYRLTLLAIFLQVGNFSIFKLRNKFRKLSRKVKHLFTSPEDLYYRYNIFQANYEYLYGESSGPNKIKTNSKHSSDKSEKTIADMQPGLELNEKAFYTEEELEKYFLIKEPLQKYIEEIEKAKNTQTARLLQQEADREFLKLEAYRFNKIPKKINWAEKGLMGKVVDQGKCNACHMITILDTINARARLKYGQEIDQLSVQEVIDCSKNSKGCKGDTPLSVYEYIIKNGVSFEKDYETVWKENPSCSVKLSISQRLLQKSPQVRRGSFLSKLKKKILNLKSYTLEKYKTGQIESSLVKFLNDISMEGSIDEHANSSKAVNISSSFYKANSAKKEIREEDLSGKSMHEKLSLNLPENINNALVTKTQEILNNNSLKKENSKNIDIFESNIFPRFNKLKDFAYVYPSIRSLLIAVSEGPVAIAYHVSKSLLYLKSGVFFGVDCTHDAKPNHASIAVGYEIEGSQPYILLKNSWGLDWGEKGYFRMAIKSTDEGATGICIIGHSGVDTYPIFE